MNNMEADINKDIPAVDRGESIGLMEPLIVSESSKSLMWMAPAWREFFCVMITKRIDCGLMSGLFLRHCSSAGPDEVSGSGPNLSLAHGSARL